MKPERSRSGFIVLRFPHKLMSALISSIVAFIVAGLAVFGLVPRQQQISPSTTPEQTATSSTEEPSLQILDAVSYPPKITVAYQNMSSAVKALFLCSPNGACTE